MNNIFAMIISAVFLIASPLQLFAETKAKAEAPQESKLTYPELEVTPRASERLEIEAKYERRGRWTVHLPIQFSALATIYAAGNVSHKDGLSTKEQDNYSAAQQLASGVGAGWLVITLSLSALYVPYYSGLREVSKLPKGNDRENLTRERIAEEALYEPAGLADKLKWFSVASNLIVNSQLIQNTKRESIMALGIGIMSSFVPLLFDYRWSKVASQHREYKKKIYGPIASATLLPVTDHEYRPGVGLLWTF